MGKHLDWSRISPDIAIWCQTMEEDMDFHQACEEHGILWMAGDRPNPDGKYCMSGHCAMRDCRTDSVITPYSDLLVEDKPAKSRLAEILGVEEGEHFKVDGFGPEFYISDSGEMLFDECAAGPYAIFWAINHPESIIRKPRFAEDELAMLRCFAAAGVIEVSRDEKNRLWTESKDHGSRLWPDGLFLSILPNQSVELAEVLEATT